MVNSKTAMIFIKEDYAVLHEGTHCAEVVCANQVSSADMISVKRVPYTKRRFHRE